MGRGEAEGNRGGGGAEQAAPALGDKGDGGGGGRGKAVEDFLDKLIAEKLIHFPRVFPFSSPFTFACFFYFCLYADDD